MWKRRKTKLAVGAAAGALVLVGLGAAAAIAASSVLSPSEESTAVIEDAAGQLGIEPDALSDALKEAFKNRIDAAVDAGRLTQEQADALKERIDSGNGIPLFGGFGLHGPGFGHLGHFGHFGHVGPLGHFGSLGAAADYLGVTEAELREQLRDKTLVEIAKEKGKTVAGLVQALVNSAQKAIDEAVADGRLTKEQAEQLTSPLESRIEDLVNGEFRRPGLGLRRGFEFGDASPRAPPLFRGLRA